MNHCRRCDSDYNTPGTCNCYAPLLPSSPLPISIPSPTLTPNPSPWPLVVPTIWPQVTW